MKKIKYILLSFGLILCNSVIVAARHKYIQSEHSLEDQAYSTRNPHPQPHPEKSNASTVVDDVINIVLDQGFAGAIILILGVWTFRTDKQNRTQQEKHFTKFVELNAECNSAMSTVAARLDNIEREIEASKQLQMLTSAKG